MVSAILFFLSIGLQLSAAVTALLLIRTTGRKVAWILLSLAMLLMAWRRMVTLVALFSSGETIPFDLPEYIALMISALMLLGVLRIGAYFRSIRMVGEERRKTEQALRESEIQFRAVFESTRDAVAVSKNGVHVFANPAYLKLFGYESLDKLAGTSILDCIAPSCHREIVQNIQRRKAGEKVSSFYETRGRKTDGTEFDFEINVSTYDLHGETYTLANVRDITERKWTDEAIRKSEEQYRTLMEQAADGIFLANQEGRYIDVNTSGCRLLGYTREEILQMTMRDVTTLTSDNPLRMAELREGKSLLSEREMIRKDGTLVPVEISAKMLSDGRFQGIVRDITERRQAEEALTNREHFVQRVLGTTPNLIYIYDLMEHRNVYANREVFDFLGYTAEQVQAMGSQLFTNILHPDDAAHVGQHHACFITAGDSDMLEVTYRMKRSDGQWRWLHSRDVLFARDNDGKPSQLLGTTEDITERRQAEDALREKNAEMERFTYTASHDLRSPLVTLKTFLGFLQEDFAAKDAERVAKDMDFMRTAANKMGVLLDELLEMSRVGRVVTDPVRVTFRELVDEAMAAVAGRIAEKKMDVRVEEVDVVLFGDRPRLAEIWQNLIENAVKYMGDQEASCIEVGAESNEKETIFFVRDNGMGIALRYKDKVFGLFEKLDVKSEGTGLGLALVKRIVELNNGRIWFESEGAGKGTCFKFTLPDAILN